MDEYLDKSPNAGRKGKAAELLIAAHCILVSDGELNVSTSYVDDEGVDLVFHRRSSSTTYAVQVKARFTSAKTVQERRRVAVSVRHQTFSPRPGLGMLIAVVDDTQGRLVHTWLVPSIDFLRIASRSGTRGSYRFAGTPQEGSRDKWSQYRVSPADLPAKILEVLADLS